MDAGGCRQTYQPERPKGAKDEVKRPPAAKPAASKADYSRPRQTIVDYSRPRQTTVDQSILLSAVLPASPMPLMNGPSPLPL